MPSDLLADLPADDVSIHSQQKHALLEAYLRVWTQNVGGNWGSAAPSLDIYDLFAGTGLCVEREYRRHQWPGTALLSAEQLKDYPSKSLCVLFLNSWAEDPTERSRNLEALRKRINHVGIERGNRKVRVISEEISAALPLALESHSGRKQYPSLWILDPYAASDVPWAFVESIANQVGLYRKKDGSMESRRPELFINFMTSSLQRNIHSLPMVTSALGCSAPEWESHLEEVESSGGTSLDALTTFYISQLQALYGRDPEATLIPGKDGNPVSVVFIAVERPAAWYSIRKESIPHFEDWREHKYEPRKEWVRRRHKIDRNLPRGQKQTDLGDSFP